MAVKVEGVPDLKAKLSGLTSALRKRVLRNALSAGARVVRDDAKRNAPVLAMSSMDAPFRQPGTLKKAIRVRTSKTARREGNVGVFVNVKPAGRGQRGAKSATDPFYWRWQEFGWRAGKKLRRFIPGRKFLTNAADKLPEALRIFNESVGKYIDKVNASGKP